MFRSFTFAVVVFLASALSAQAATLSFSPDADGYVLSNSSVTNFGTSSIVQVKNDGGGTAHRKAYMRYDISGIALNEAITSASLDINFVESGAGSGLAGVNTFEVFGLNDGDAGENWIESGAGGITWDNAPANAAGGATVTSSASSLGTFSITGHTGTVNFTGIGGTAVEDFLNASVSDDLVSFIVVRLTDSSGGNYVHGFDSKEAVGGAGALLNVETRVVPPVPEPATGLLVGLVSCIVLPQLRRRRNKNTA